MDDAGSGQFLARVQHDLAKRETQKQVNELKKTGLLQLKM
jgi:hypothetical protein